MTNVALSGMAWNPMVARNMAGHSSIAAEMLEGGVNPTALDDKHCSALHYASGKHNRTEFNVAFNTARYLQ